MTPPRPIRVLHCPTAVGGHAPGLAHGERALGLDSHCLTYRQRHFDYRVDEVLWRPGQSRASRHLARLGVLRRARRDFDVVHFNFGSGILARYAGATDPRLAFLPVGVRQAAAACSRLLEFVDVRRLRAAGKAIVVTYQGDDARQGDYCREHFAIHASDEAGPDYYTESGDRCRRRWIRRFGELADLVLALNPDLLHVLPPETRFIPYASVDLRDWLPVARDHDAARPPVVAHAPTHRGVKGTRFVVDAIARLRAEGLEIDFRLVEGRSRDEARRVYEQSDLFVDQLLLGWYGGAAVELMALGKPVVAYVRDEDLSFIPARMAEQLPLIRATPESIVDVLRHELTAGRDQWQARGRAGRAFVESWHDPLELARQHRAFYERLLDR